jgi:hypothetical protein
MTPEEALNVADEALYAHRGKHLTDIQRMILQESLANRRYEEMQGYQTQHIKNEGSQLWRLLSEALDKRLKSGNIRGNVVGRQNAPVLNLLALEIQQDCSWLQELLDHDDKVYLSDKWTSCFSKNRSVWQDLPSRLSLVQSSSNLMQLVQDFYRKVDLIEESCQKLLTLKLQIIVLESKQKYSGGILGFDTMHPPEWTKEYFTESDAIGLIFQKKKYFMKFKSMKETICETLELANRIVTELSQQSS